MNNLKGYGLIIPPITTKEEGVEDVLGSSKLKGQVINSSGDWRPYLPEKEPQFKRGVETNGCTVYGTLNAIETLIRFKTGVQVNYSDRYLANVARKYGKLDPFSGADPHQVAELVRTVAGCLREDRLPWTDDIKTTNDYYLVQELVELMEEGERWYDEWDFSHGWVFNKGTPQEKRVKLEEALTKGTVCVSVFAWKYANDKEWYYKDEGDQDGHWTQLTAAKDRYYVFDSYDGFEKHLDPLYDFQIAKVFYLEPAGSKLNILQQIVNLLAQVIGLQAIFVKKKINEDKVEPVVPIDVDPPPPVPPVAPPIDKVQVFAKAIQQFEGYFRPGENANYPNGSVSYKCKNPGNLKWTPYTVELGAIGKSSSGFCIFRSYEEGFGALKQFIKDARDDKLKNYHGKDIYGFFEVYAPSSDGNSPLQYAQSVARKCNVSVNTKLKNFL